MAASGQGLSLPPESSSAAHRRTHRQISHLVASGLVLCCSFRVHEAEPALDGGGRGPKGAILFSWRCQPTSVSMLDDTAPVQSHSLDRKLQLAHCRSPPSAITPRLASRFPHPVHSTTR